jgi:hypothetical protein
VPVVSVIVPEAHAAVQATRNRHGLLATVDRRADGTRLVRTLDAGRASRPLPAPLVPHDQAGTLQRQRRRCGTNMRPRSKMRVDTVILGCTHYPLLGPMVFQRTFGRDVTPCSQPNGVCEVAEPARKGFSNDTPRVRPLPLSHDRPALFRTSESAANCPRRRRAGRGPRAGGGGVVGNDGRKPTSSPVDAAAFSSSRTVVLGRRADEGALHGDRAGRSSALAAQDAAG